MKRIMILLSLFIFALAITSCGPSKVEYTIEMTEFGYSPESIELQVGQEVTLHLVNLGALEHELMIGRKVLTMDDLPSGFEHDFFEGTDPEVHTAMPGHEDDGHEEEEHEGETQREEGETHSKEGEDHEMDEHAHSGFMVTLPGNTKEQITSVTFTVTESMVGEWDMGCFLDKGSHYTAGMHGNVVVKE